MYKKLKLNIFQGRKRYYMLSVQNNLSLKFIKTELLQKQKNFTSKDPNWF